MEKAEIRRHKMTAIIDTPAIEATVAEEAAALLGYGAPSKEELQASRSALQTALAETGIEILSLRDVLLYQYEHRCAAEIKALDHTANFDNQRPRWPPSHNWQETPIAQFRGLVPEYVLHKAVVLKKAIPEVEFTIEHLEETSDPFLIAKVKKGTYDEEAYYIEVWDEKDFERRI